LPGGEVGAIDGTLSVMVGGDAADFEAAKPVLNAVGSTFVHVGHPVRRPRQQRPQRNPGQPA
jgi:3-hydroxyisobutyrate dehydrogenase-like beta-hydroxyacid dehydrogenase